MNKLINKDLINSILISPITQGCNQLIIISGYASHNMASWHLKKINEEHLSPISIQLIVGMCPEGGIPETTHEGFKNLTAFNQNGYSSFQCSYIYQGSAVHSKIYIWLKNKVPQYAYTGSSNYTQSGFSINRREYMVPCDPQEAFNYYQLIEKDTIFCTHSEIHETIQITKDNSIKDFENNNPGNNTLQSVTLSLLTNKGEIGFGSGLNWGHRPNGIKREPNQAYIRLPIQIARQNFFPLDKKHFTVITDDNKQLILRTEQQNNKAITTPLNNSLLGEYFRNRLNLPNGSFITKDDLLRYGRTDVTFYKIDDEQFFMDFNPSH